MNRNELYNSDFGKNDYNDDFSYLPVSSQAFEAMLEEAGKRAGLPIDDGVRIAVVSYLHHLSNDHSEINMATIAAVVRVAYSRGLTYVEGQKAKERIEQAAKEAYEEQQKASSLKLVKDEPQ